MNLQSATLPCKIELLKRFSERKPVIAKWRLEKWCMHYLLNAEKHPANSESSRCASAWRIRGGGSQNNTIGLAVHCGLGRRLMNKENGGEYCVECPTLLSIHAHIRADWSSEIRELASCQPTGSWPLNKFFSAYSDTRWDSKSHYKSYSIDSFVEIFAHIGCSKGQ